MYRITALGTLPGYSGQVVATGLNEWNQVSGYMYAGGAGSQVQGFRWSPVLGMQGLGALQGTGNSTGQAISDAGRVAGWAIDAGGTTSAVGWSNQATGLQELADVPGGAADSAAFAINTQGQVAGYAGTAAGRHAIKWLAGGGYVDLGDLAGGVDLSEAYGLNDQGAVVGRGGVAGGAYHAFLWTQVTGMTDLGVLAGTLHSQALAISEGGIVIGQSWTTDSILDGQAVMWNGGSAQSLGTLPGHASSLARGVNDLGQVVGSSRPAAGLTRAFVFDSTNGMRDLNSLIDPSDPLAGLLFVTAAGVNNGGHILATGYDGANVRAYILSPNEPVVAVPDAGSLMLAWPALLAALGALRCRLGQSRR